MRGAAVIGSSIWLASLPGCGTALPHAARRLARFSAEARMRGQRGATVGNSASTSDDWGVEYAALLKRVNFLPGPGAAVDLLISDIVSSVVPESAFGPLAAAIAKATKLDKGVLTKQMKIGRAAARSGVEGRTLATNPPAGPPAAPGRH